MAVLHGILYMVALGVISHVVGQALPRRWFDWTRFPYASAKWEKRGAVYERLHIRRWKNRLPDMSRVLKDMVPKRMGRDVGSAEVEVLIRETCVAELVHAVLFVLAPTIVHVCKHIVGVILAALFAAGNVPFILIQRYNRPKLVCLWERMKKREECGNSAHSDTVG